MDPAIRRRGEGGVAGARGTGFAVVHVPGRKSTSSNRFCDGTPHRLAVEPAAGALLL